MSIKREIANKLGLNLKEQDLVFKAIDIYEATCSADQPTGCAVNEAAFKYAWDKANGNIIYEKVTRQIIKDYLHAPASKINEERKS